MYDLLFIGLAAGGAFLLSFLLFTNPKSHNKQANRWLACFTATFAGAMLEIFFHKLNLHHSIPVISDLMEAGRFLSAPLLYLSVLSFTSADKKVKAIYILHFLLFAAAGLLLLPHMLTGQNVRFPNQQIAQIVLTFFRLALPLQTLTYWGLAYMKLTRHQHNIRKIASSTEEIDLSWLKYFLWVLAVVVLAWLNLAIFHFAPFMALTPFLYLLSVYFLAYFSLKQKEIYPFTNPALAEVEIVIAAKTEKQKRLSDSQVKILSQKLENLMEKEKVYLDNELSLPALAEKMQITSHELSYLINEVYGVNFFLYANRYRVEEAKSLLLSENFEKLNMLGIAFQAGFNSKTSFNTAFKKQAGQTPSEFVLAHRK